MCGGRGEGGGNVCADHLCFLSRLSLLWVRKASRGVTGASAAIGLGVDNMSRQGEHLLKIQGSETAGHPLGGCSHIWPVGESVKSSGFSSAVKCCDQKLWL